MITAKSYHNNDYVNSDF